MTDLNTRDAKLVQYLNEAYGKEKELETALESHIAMTTRVPYRKRLQDHLTETKRHARELERRIKKLGGEAEWVPLPGPEAIAKGASVAAELGSRAIAAAKGPLHMLRGTGEQEKMLKNAKTEYSEEHEEIATYSAIEVLATALGDGDTAKLARAIRREEERMARFLQGLIPALTKAVIQEEVPPAQRRTAAAARKRSPSKRASAAGGKASASKRSPAKRSTAKRATTKRATTAKRSSAKTTAKSTTAKRATAKRATAKRATAKRATAKRTTAKSATAKRATGASSKGAAAKRARTAAKRTTGGAKRAARKPSAAKR